MHISNALLTPDRTLNTEHLPLDHPLHLVINSTFASHEVQRGQTTEPRIYWGESRFKLDRSSVFQSLSTELRDRILLRMTELNLALSYFIEKSGHHYSAKMMLLSPTSEEKTLYAFFAAEEAMHLREFMNYMWFTPTLETHHHPMLPALADAIEWGSRDTLVFVLQVLLEGFGIAHYTGLKDSALDPRLKQTFQAILKDEARHHGAGLILTKARKPTPEIEDQIFELSRRFIRSMEGAHWLAGAFEHSGRPLSTDESRRLWEEIGFRQTLGDRMVRLREMFERVNFHSLYQRLENDGVFRIQSI